MQDFMLQSVFVRGEVSNCKYHSSGHIYFTLKDAKGTIACVMFAGNRSGLSFTLREGMQVVVGGTIDVYERDGKYQLYAKQILQEGSGFLYEKFEELKRELEERGMFAAQYKRPVPKYIRTLGVVTAPTGAAVRDIINVATRRNPHIRIILYPAIVQGEAAAAGLSGKIKIIAFDKVPTTKALVEDGVIAATICQQPRLQGTKPLDILFAYLTAGEFPAKEYHYVAVDIRIKENI